MARRMGDALANVPGARFITPVEANGVFVHLPSAVIAGLQKNWRFYVFVGETGCRFMCAWDTPVEMVDRFCADVRELSRSAA